MEGFGFGAGLKCVVCFSLSGFFVVPTGGAVAEFADPTSLGHPASLPRVGVLRGDIAAPSGAHLFRSLAGCAGQRASVNCLAHKDCE